MGGKKNRGPSGPSVEQQYKTARTVYQGRARDVAAEGGGVISDFGASTEELNAPRRFVGGKQGALNKYKNRMEAKFKGAGTAPGNIRDQQANAGAGAGSTNVVSPGSKQKQILGEEEKKNSLFV